MFVRKIAAVMLLMLVASVSYGQRGQAPLKGYQLFTWKEKGHWHYSLLPGTNRERTYAEITAPPAVIVGTSNFESELKRLPKGTQVLWQSDAPAGIKAPGSGGAMSFKHPSRKRIERIKSVCDKLGIKLSLT
jgi:hypothetical protein